MTTDTQTPDDEFAAAFADLQAPAGTPTVETPPAAVVPETPPAETPPAATAPETPPVETPPAATAPETPPVETPPAATAPETPAADPIQAELAALRAELAALRPAPAVEPAPVETPPAPVYSADEQTAVNKYLEDWPEVAKGEALLRRAEYGQVVKYIFDQLGPQLEQLTQYYERSSTSSQYRDLVALVPDYDQVRDATLAWIDTQPAYLKDAYQQVANGGSAQDVADLIGRFKKETGYAPATQTPAVVPAAAPAAPVAPATAAPAANAALPSATAAVVASLKPVKTGRSEPVSAADPNDFDAAFKEFASAG